MAISILSQPHSASTVYNEHWLNVYSTNVLGQNFSYIFDIYTGSTATTKIARYRISPYPSSANGYLNPNKTLEKYLTSDKNFTMSGISTAPNSIIQYFINIGEEYGPSTAPLVVYPNLASMSGYSFNGVAQYEDLASGYYNSYIGTFTLTGASTSLIPYPGPTVTKFLTEKPNGDIPIQPNERETLGYLNINNDINYIRLVTLPTSGGSEIFYISNNTISATTSDDRRLNIIGVGVPNLLEIPNSAIFIKSGLTLVNSTQPLINTATTSQYKICAVEPDYLSADIEKSLTYTYNIYENCSKYNTIRICFLNRHGQFDFYSFNKVSRKTYNSERKTFTKLLAPNYTLGSAGKTVYDVSGTKSMTVNTDYIDQETGSWLAFELLYTKEAYEIRNGNQLIPIIIDRNSIEDIYEINGVPIQYQFNYTYANAIRGQR